MKEENTRFTCSEKAIERDFAEHLKYTRDAHVFHTTDIDRYTALVLTIRDRIIHQWGTCRDVHRTKKVKRVYYLSLEFLMGRAMTNNIINMQIEDIVKSALKDLGYKYEDLADIEADAGLGNGGLGRLAACFLDSLATLDYPSYGYGIRYNYGIFKQQIKNGFQVEQPDSWLEGAGNPWEVPRYDIEYCVNFGGRVETLKENGRDVYKWVDTEIVKGMAYDMPIVGYGGKTVNTLRLWSAKADNEFDFQDFNEGDYTEAVREKISAENISQVLYPNDTGYMGKVLRLKQQYFFVSCSLSDIFRRFKREHGEAFQELPNYAAIQLNDTHPSISVAELMRKLVDEENLDWNISWDITCKTLGYTNHTLMSEALEKWPVDMMQKLLPRHMQIIYEINYRFLQNAITFFPFKPEAISKISIIEEANPKMVRMANLAIIGCHAVNGVAALHSKLLKEKMFPEFNTLFPERFQNKTNGITQRRWLLDCNPMLASFVTEAIGPGWITDFDQISRLEPFAKDRSFCESFANIKYQAKIRAVDFLKKDCSIKIDPDSIFDVQVKRIHEYKRQLLNALNILMIYMRLKEDSVYYNNFKKTVFLFGGKAAPGYVNAKLSIKLINNLSQLVNIDKSVNKKLQVYFMPNYRVTQAEYIIPATNISEQLSTAGLEASGTGNMKFMINGALTLGTWDGANIEMAQAVGKDNIFIFGKKEDELSKLRNNYDPYDFILEDKEIKKMVELLLSGFFSVGEPGVFDPLRRAIFEEKDKYFIFADLRDYFNKHQQALDLYNEDFGLWNQKAVLNIANSGKFSSDRTIKEYAKDIWSLESCKVPKTGNRDSSLKEARKK